MYHSILICFSVTTGIFFVEAQSAKFQNITKHYSRYKPKVDISHGYLLATSLSEAIRYFFAFSK